MSWVPPQSSLLGVSGQVTQAACANPEGCRPHAHFPLVSSHLGLGSTLTASSSVPPLPVLCHLPQCHPASPRVLTHCLAISDSSDSFLPCVGSS